MSAANEGISDEAIRLAAVALVEAGIYDDDSRHITGYAHKAARAALEAARPEMAAERDAARAAVARVRALIEAWEQGTAPSIDHGADGVLHDLRAALDASNDTGVTPTPESRSDRNLAAPSGNPDSHEWLGMER